jgi:hypothetical protein
MIESKDLVEAVVERAATVTAALVLQYRTRTAGLHNNLTGADV